VRGFISDHATASREQTTAVLRKRILGEKANNQAALATSQAPFSRRQNSECRIGHELMASGPSVEIREYLGNLAHCVVDVFHGIMPHRSDSGQISSRF
jgi:hypothetical protein